MLPCEGRECSGGGGEGGQYGVRGNVREGHTGVGGRGVWSMWVWVRGRGARMEHMGVWNMWELESAVCSTWEWSEGVGGGEYGAHRSEGERGNLEHVRVIEGSME